MRLSFLMFDSLRLAAQLDPTLATNDGRVRELWRLIDGYDSPRTAFSVKRPAAGRFRRYFRKLDFG